MSKPLHDRWNALVAQIGGVDTGVFSLLCSLYDTPTRTYHHLGHVADCLEALSSITDAPPVAAEYAIWFHDAVYVPGASNNEQASAELAGAYGVALGLDESTRLDAINGILATRTHSNPSSDIAAMVIDADLSILASDCDGYAAYSKAIRDEWSHIPGPAFRRGRAEFIGSFLNRPRLFFTDRGYELWETAARDNLETEHRSLSEAE